MNRLREEPWVRSDVLNSSTSLNFLQIYHQFVLASVWWSPDGATARGRDLSLHFSPIARDARAIHYPFCPEDTMEMLLSSSLLFPVSDILSKTPFPLIFPPVFRPTHGIAQVSTPRFSSPTPSSTPSASKSCAISTTHPLSSTHWASSASASRSLPKPLPTNQHASSSPHSTTAPVNPAGRFARVRHT